MLPLVFAVQAEEPESASDTSSLTMVVHDGQQQTDCKVDSAISPCQRAHGSVSPLSLRAATGTQVGVSGDMAACGTDGYPWIGSWCA